MGRPGNQPTIDESTRMKSPGLRNNFFETPTSDFKRPYGSNGAGPTNGTGWGQGMGQGMGMRQGQGMGQGMGQSQGMGQGMRQGQGMGQGHGMGQGQSMGQGMGQQRQQPQQQPQQQNMRMGHTMNRNQPAIDESTRMKSPGLRNNFFETPVSDFKRPYGS
jgi:hypothetical protein